MTHGSDKAYLEEQYGTIERLQARILAHQRYSERVDDYREWTLDHLAVSVGDLVLDVGCGFGSYHPDLIERGARAILGVDASKMMVQTAQRQAVEKRLPVVVIHADAQALPLPDNTYDRVLANHMLFHVPDQRAALLEMRRVTHPGGRVLIGANAFNHASRLTALHAAAARQLGYTPSQRVTDRFHLGHLSLVREAFSTRLIWHLQRILNSETQPRAGCTTPPCRSR